MSNKSHQITLYSKPGCHLCEDAKEALFSLKDEYEVSLQEVNINDDPAIFEQYKYTIPVMVIDEKIVLEARIDARKLRRAFAEGYGPTYRIIR
jgi:glutaredoxin